MEIQICRKFAGLFVGEFPNKYLETNILKLRCFAVTTEWDTLQNQKYKNGAVVPSV